MVRLYSVMVMSLPMIYAQLAGGGQSVHICMENVIAKCDLVEGTSIKDDAFVQTIYKTISIIL